MVPRFYLPKSNWPLRGPCLFCFSREHVTKEHAKTGANIKSNKENDPGEEETEEEEQEEGVGVVALKEGGPDGGQEKEKEKPSAIKTSIGVGAKKEIVEGVGSGGLVVEGGEDEEETEEGSEDSVCCVCVSFTFFVFACFDVFHPSFVSFH